jgi:hypothetical protein
MMMTLTVRFCNQEVSKVSKHQPMLRSKHYGKILRCRATVRTTKTPLCPAKALPCVEARHARQRPPSKGSDGNVNVAVRIANSHGKDLCRACARLPCGRCFAVHTFFAVRRGVCRAWGLCRAVSSLLQRGYHACRSAAVSTASLASSELLIDGWIHRLASCAPRVVDWPCASGHTTTHFLLCGWVLISIPFIMLLSLNLCSALRNKKK